jgi:hypothetical protein
MKCPEARVIAGFSVFMSGIVWQQAEAPSIVLAWH